MSARKHLVVCLGLALLAVAFFVPTAQGAFGIESVTTTAINRDGTVDTQAGSHPYAWEIAIAMNKDANGRPEGKLSSLVVNLPPGLLGNPQVAVRCTGAEFDGQISECSGDSQVGIVRTVLPGLGVLNRPLGNLVPGFGVPAAFGFSVLGQNSFQEASIRSDGDFGASVSDISVPTRPAEIQEIRETIWGVPAGGEHDPERICYPEGAGAEVEGCSAEVPPAPFFTLPTSCGGPIKTVVTVESLENPGVKVNKSALSTDTGGTPFGIDGCNALEFEPSISSQPTTNLADSPTGLDFKLHVPQPPAVEQTGGSPEICSKGTWSEEPTEFKYQWLRNGDPIPGATSSAYVAQDSDASASLQCEVRAINGAIGPGRAISTPRVLLPKPPVAPPRIGHPFVQMLEGVATCNPGNWGGSPGFTYSWFENGSLVPGQGASTYTPTAGPFTLQCEVAGTNAGGAVVALSNSVNSSPPPAPPLPGIERQPTFQLDESTVPLATAHLKDTTVTLPQGMTINPSVANGLAACSEGQIGYAPSEGGIHFSEDPQSCPDASKLGTVEVTTPLLKEKLPGQLPGDLGAVYLAKPYENPFGSLMAIYLAIEDHQTGIVAKLAGKVIADPNTGQLTATFTENPQLPLEDVALHFFKGPKAALKTPLACGKYTTSSTLVPWSTPEGATVNPTDSFQTSVAAGGSGACPQTEAQAPNKPSFSAGTLAPAAGAYSPFVLKITRQDGTQRLKQIDAALPKGLTGKLAGIPYCPEAAIARAIAREAPNQGTVEQAHPSCPAASEVGTATVGAGAGITPYYATGHAYLSGPYKGAPLSMVIITPAVAGPFDLGAVVVRTPFYVDPETAQIHASSDPIPSIIEGVPLDIRSIAVKLDRPSFTLNPTSCDPMQVLGSTTSTIGSLASLSNPFQVGGCKALKFAPKLNLSLKGGTKRGRFPALKAALSFPQGNNYANTASAQVTLPHGEFIEQAHFKTICTNVQFKADACPAGAIYGKARAFTPLLDRPVQGPVYLRSSTHKLPDLVISLKGQVDADLVGRIDTGKNKGLRTTFQAAPDVPVTKVVLEMQGGKKGLLVNSENICSKDQKAIADFTAQNGKVSETTPLVKNDCKGKKRRKGGQGKKAHGGKR